MKKVLLLGSNGQLGSDIVRVSKGIEDIKLHPLTRADIDAEKDDVADKLAMHRDCDAVINCISYHKTDECEDYPEKTFQINSLFVLHLTRFCAENDITLFQISTDYVFDGEKNEPYAENNPVNPLNVYGAAKAVSEFLVRNYLSRHFVFRVSSLFGAAGASGKGGNFIETMLRLAKEKKPLKVIGDQYMSPTHTLDVARLIVEFIKSDVNAYGTYHCCNSGSCSWYEFAAEIFDLCGLDADLSETTYAEYKTRAVRPRYSVMNNSKVGGIYKMPHWREALKEYLKIKGHPVMAVKS